MLRASHALSATMLALLAAVAAPAHAQSGPFSVDTVATDLVNTSSLDLWQFDFTVNGQMATNATMDITLPLSLFSNVSVLSSQAGYNAEITFPPASRLLLITDTGSTATTSSFSVLLTLVPGALPLPTILDLGAGYNNGGATVFPDTREFVMRPLAAPVPEPATYGLMALGLAAIGLRRRAQKA